MGDLELKFWDVQHGSATHITTPNGRRIVIDLGDADSVTGTSRFSPLMDLKYEHSVDVIDLLVITHPHRDHVDDIEQLSNFDVTTLYRPKWLTEEDVRGGNRQQDNAKITQYLDLSARFTVPASRPNQATVPEDWGGLIIKFFDSRAVPTNNLNNHSIVTFLQYAGLKVMIPGDNESASWGNLLERADFRSELSEVDVFVASHHGRESGFCIDLFQAGLNPRITIISDDQVTSTSVTEKYAAQTRGWTVYDTDGTSEQRFCLTTRADGTIGVKIGNSSSGNFLNVVRCL